jgi:hypothetical protein
MPAGYHFILASPSGLVSLDVPRLFAEWMVIALVAAIPLLIPQRQKGNAPRASEKGAHKPSPQPPPELIQKETAETLLRKLVESPNPSNAAARYILARLLERKRILKHRDTVRAENGGELLVYEHTSTGELFTIPDPHLRLDQLEQVQQEIAALLHPPTEDAKAKSANVPSTASALDERRPVWTYKEPIPIFEQLLNQKQRLWSSLCGFGFRPSKGAWTSAIMKRAFGRKKRGAEQ